jgi:hypothetical protein
VSDPGSCDVGTARRRCAGVLKRAAVGAQGLSTRVYKRDIPVCGRWEGYGAIIKNFPWGERTETTTTPCGDCPRCQTVAALASCTAACRASATLMRRHCLWLGIDRPVIPPGRARTKAASGHLDERLPPTTAELLENSDEYELHDQIRQKWPPLSPETLRGRSPVSDAREHGIYAEGKTDCGQRDTAQRLSRGPTACSSRATPST